MQRSARTGIKLDSTECEILRADGTTKFTREYTRPLLDQAGRIRGSIGVFFDDTDRVELIRELRRSNDDLSHFAHLISHDLREPLRTLSCFSGLIVGDPQGPDTAGYAKHVRDAALRMSELISGVLDYAILRQDHTPGPLMSIDCSAALQHALMNLRVVIAENDAVITSAPLPVVEGNCALLTQVFQNLIGNAIRYRVAASPRIHVSAEEQNGEWMFRVCDNGAGFDMCHAETIFAPFRRLDTSKREGAGIGLTICRRIIERNGGRIFAESIPDAGSTFFFTLPVSPAQNVHRSYLTMS